MAGKATKDAYTLIKEAYARAERVSGDGTEIGGTGATVLKQGLPPVAHLLRPRGPDQPPAITLVEQRAADEINYAIMTITAPLRIRSGSMEYVDGRGYDPGYGMARQADTVKRYKAWADFWSKRRNLYGDPMLEVVFAGVVDEVPLKQIAVTVGRRHGVVRNGFIAGLRDYAARAGWATKEEARIWKREADLVFSRKPKGY